jgi:beta-lactamase superfamily II metal-dependent hydrolase
MSIIVKSFSVGEGDMFYIKHGTSNFTIIDSFLTEENKDTIVNELIAQKKGKDIVRFISTHPDDDHIGGLMYLDDKIGILNFYCVKNEYNKENTEDYTRYYALRDDNKTAFYLSKDF